MVVLKAVELQSQSRNQLGQAMGAKGMKTRRRLIDAVVHLLNETKPEDLKIADIAIATDTSAATFYVYFTDVYDTILAAANELSQGTPAMLALLSSEWTAANADDQARQFVELYASFWDQHRTVLRLRNLAAENGDQRFWTARNFAAAPLLEALESLILRAQGKGDADTKLHARSTAGVLLMMMERVGTLVPMFTGQNGITRSRALQSASHLLAQAVGCAGICNRR